MCRIDTSTVFAILVFCPQPEGTNSQLPCLRYSDKYNGRGLLGFPGQNQ
jgi:hypothetical protein